MAIFGFLQPSYVPRQFTMHCFLNCYIHETKAYLDQLLNVLYLYKKISNDTEELEGRSEDYASLANEFLKKMEKRKWWQL